METITSCKRFFPIGRDKVCDSLKTYLWRVTRQSINSVYGNCVGNCRKIPVTFLKVEKQNNEYSCSLFAITIAAELLNSTSPLYALFDVRKLQLHLINFLESETSTSFYHLT